MQYWCSLPVASDFISLTLNPQTILDCSTTTCYVLLLTFLWSDQLESHLRPETSEEQLTLYLLSFCLSYCRTNKCYWAAVHLCTFLSLYNSVEVWNHISIYGQYQAMSTILTLLYAIMANDLTPKRVWSIRKFWWFVPKSNCNML